MPDLFCLGLGYSARAFIAGDGDRFATIAGTVRGEAQQQTLAANGVAGRAVTALLFDGRPRAEIAQAMCRADAMLVSAPPAALATAAADMLGRAHRAPAVVYLSSLSVYGDYAGAAIDETAALRPGSARGQERVAAEDAWRQFGRDTGCPVAILRLAGIYGPGRNALASVASGTARRIVKPGQVFNRIHVADIAQAIAATFQRRADGVFNVADDEPAPPQDVIACAAVLLRMPLPPAIAFDDALPTLSPMARSFYAESKRALNGRLKTDLGITLRYPTYREGLAALCAAGEGDASGSP